MGYTLGEAARAASISKASIGRAIKSGRLSATRQVDGTYSIDPSELARVYPVTGDGAGPLRRSATGGGDGVTPDRDGYRALVEETIHDLRTRLDRAERRISELDDERREVQRQLTATQERLTALLTDQRSDRPRGGPVAAIKVSVAETVPSPAPVPVAPRNSEPVPKRDNSPLAFRSPWWRRWFR